MRLGENYLRNKVVLWALSDIDCVSRFVSPGVLQLCHGHGLEQVIILT